MGIKPSDLQPHAIAVLDRAIANQEKTRIENRLANQRMTQAQVAAAKGKGRGRGNPRQPKRRGEMNECEKEWAKELDQYKAANDIIGYHYEQVTLNLPGGIKYCPDFFLVYSNGRVAFHEVKGHWREQDKVRFKLAVTTFPHIRFVVVWKEGGEWKRQDYNV